MTSAPSGHAPSLARPRAAPGATACRPRFGTLSLAGLALAALASCAAPTPPAADRPSPRDDTGLDRMERLALTANRCWFRSRDPAFANYSLAPELSSFSGKPRFLLVPKGRPEDRPLLVVEGRAGSAAVDVYGPLLGTEAAPRIRTDLGRWMEGAQSCSA